jgi:hypothetical protein
MAPVSVFPFPHNGRASLIVLRISDGYVDTAASRAQKKDLQSLRIPLPPPPPVQAPTLPTIDFQASSKDVGLEYLTVALPIAREVLGLKSTKETWAVLFPNGVQPESERSGKA